MFQLLSRLVMLDLGLGSIFSLVFSASEYWYLYCCILFIAHHHFL